MPFLDLQEERFYWAEAGVGAPFVFGHGLGADVSQTLAFGGDLDGWRLVAIDCRGHGQTEASLDPGRLSFTGFAGDLAALLDHLNIERAVVGGISMGAGVALAFALAHPDRVAGLALVRPAWLDHPFPENLRWFPLAADLLHNHPAEEAGRRFRQSAEYAELAAASKPAALSLLGQFGRRQARERAAVLTALPGSVPVPSLAHCGRLDMPTLVVVNGRDPIHPATLGEALVAAIPGAELVRITSKADSETRHRAELVSALQTYLQPIGQSFSPATP